MSAFFNWRGRETRVEEQENARNIWERRERGASPPPAGEADRRRWIERVAARIGFESFERGFFTLVGGVVLAGSVIAIGAGLYGPTPDEQASGTPAVLVAKQEHSEAEAAQPMKEPVKAEPARAESFKSAPAAAAPTQEAAAPLASVPSMLSQTPMRENPPAKRSPRRRPRRRGKPSRPKRKRSAMRRPRKPSSPRPRP